MDSDKDDPINSSPCEGETAAEIEKDLSNGLPGDSIAKPKQAEATRSSARTKVLTEKMKDFCLQPMERYFIAAPRACSKQVLRIRSILADDADIPALQQETGKLEARMEDFNNAHTALYDTLENEEERVNRIVASTTLIAATKKLFGPSTIKLLLFEHPEMIKAPFRRLGASIRVCLKAQILPRPLQSKRKLGLPPRLPDWRQSSSFSTYKTKGKHRLRNRKMKLRRMLKKLAATQAELEAVNKVEEQHFGVINHTEEGTLPKENCSDEHLENYLQAQVNSILHPPATSSEIPPETVTASNAFPASVQNTIAQTSVTFTNGSSSTP